MAKKIGNSVKKGQNRKRFLAVRGHMTDFKNGRSDEVELDGYDLSRE